MENKLFPSKKQSNQISISKEKLMSQFDYSTLKRDSPCLSRKQLLLDFEISSRKSHRQPSQKVLVSIKRRTPAIKTIYIAEKTRFWPKKSSDKSRSRLAIGDHSSFATYIGEYNSIDKCGTCQIELNVNSDNKRQSISLASDHVETSSSFSQSKATHNKRVYNAINWPEEKCYVYTQPKFTMNLPKVHVETDKSKIVSKKVDIGTLVISNTSSEVSALPSSNTLNKIHKRLADLERKVLRQEMVFCSIDPTGLVVSSSDDDTEDVKATTSKTGRAGCSYIEQYSHIPKTSAFQRYAQQATPLSPSKAVTLEKEHNSEQYGRDFTAYDGITARGRRQCSSVPCKREDVPKLAAERVHKIRHKLNPVRDYRLMDTVHYLAQGEFAPRDDGIKLTPSREAVLSDIIWEDVCRTHWPNTRLNRRTQHNDRCSTRCELQRLIDSMLRERVAHVERRRRRHYRIVKLNHRHETSRPVGKTGDIIVASHKNRNKNREGPLIDHNSEIVVDDRWENQSSRRSHRSHDRFMFSESRRHEPRQDDCVAGPSYAVPRSPTKREATCCYQASNTSKIEGPQISTTRRTYPNNNNVINSGSSMSSCKAQRKSPRLVVKKENSRRKYQTKEEPDLEQYILLPTLVVRTPSNVKRQKKFNELYHRILNVQINSGQNESAQSSSPKRTKKNLGC